MKLKLWNYLRWIKIRLIGNFSLNRGLAKTTKVTKIKSSSLMWNEEENSWKEWTDIFIQKKNRNERGCSWGKTI